MKLDDEMLAVCGDPRERAMGSGNGLAGFSARARIRPEGETRD